MESPYAAISLPDVAKNGAQSIIGVSPVPVSGWMTPQAGREPTQEDTRPACHSREERVALTFVASANSSICCASASNSVR